MEEMVARAAGCIHKRKKGNEISSARRSYCNARSRNFYKNKAERTKPKKTRLRKAQTIKSRRQLYHPGESQKEQTIRKGTKRANNRQTTKKGRDNLSTGHLRCVHVFPPFFLSFSFFFCHFAAIFRSRSQRCAAYPIPSERTKRGNTSTQV